MNKGQKETFSVRVISCIFVVLALAVFKPFGLDAWQWHAYIHLLAILALGIMTCMLTDVILKYVVRMPRSYDKGVSYIIRRNLWFQLINTPLVALVICLYRHFMLSGRVEENKFSFLNFIETLAIIAFCSFAIGLYWRFKYRSRFLAAELEETRMLNEKLKSLSETIKEEKAENEEQNDKLDGEENISPQVSVFIPPPEDKLLLSGTTNESISLQIPSLLYIEAVGNYVKVYHLRDGQVRTDMLRATLKQMEDDLHAYPMIVRCHRAFLVNLGQVEQIVAHSGTMQLLIKHSHEAIPVSRSNMAGVKKAING